MAEAERDIRGTVGRPDLLAGKRLPKGMGTYGIYTEFSTGPTAEGTFVDRASADGTQRCGEASGTLRHRSGPSFYGFNTGPWGPKGENHAYHENIGSIRY